MRPIDADELLDKAWFCDLDHWSGKVVDEDIINEAPTIDVVPVIRARWEEGNGEWFEMLRDWYMRQTYICSNCRKEEKKKTPYCPNCGAIMDLEVSSDENY